MFDVKNLTQQDYEYLVEGIRIQDKRMERMASVLRECDEYLSSNELNQIGSTSILHRKIKEALKGKGKGL